MEYTIDSDESVSHAVTMSVSVIENTAITDLPPLYESLDPDALNAICSGEGNTHIAFAYSHSLIDVYNGEYLTVETTPERISSPHSPA